MQDRFWLLWVISCLCWLSINSCKSVKNTNRSFEISTFRNLSFKCEASNPQVKRVNGDTMVIKYVGDTIIVANHPEIQIPKRLEESFKDQFYAVYYNRFFDKVLMDPKVRKIFRDSVNIVNVEVIKAGSNSECLNCNVIAQLKFKKNTFQFPAQLSEEIIDTAKNYELEKVKLNGFDKLILRSKAEHLYTKIYVWNEDEKYVIQLKSSFPNIQSIYQSATINN